MTSAESTSDRLATVVNDGALEERRRRVRELLAEQRRRLSQLEQSASQASSLTDRPVTSDTTSVVVAERQQALLEQIVRQLQQLEEAPAASPQTVIADDGRLAEETARVERLKNELAVAERRLAEEREAVARARKELETERAAVRELQSARTAAANDLAKLATELSQVRAEADQRLAEARQDQAREFRESLQALTSQSAAMSGDRERLQEEVLLARETVASLEAEISRLKSAAEESQFAAPVVDTAELEQLRKENRMLARRVEQLDAEVNAAPPAADDGDLQRRLEMALQDVRELKAKNQELASQAKNAAANVSTLGGGQSYDWEAQKQRLLAQLESDFDENVPQEKSDKLTVQGAIRITDQIIAEKDHEIEELRHMLDTQSAGIGDVAVGASAIAQMFDQDELIRQERENLKRQQEEVQQMLKAAEVGLSVERAQIARERQKLEELARQVAMERELAGVKETNAADGDASKSSRGKWLQRLGLKDKGG